MRHSNRYRDFLLYILYNSNSLGMNRKVVGIHFKNEKEKSVMSRSVKEIIENCREAKEEMSLSDFKTCIDAIYFHMGQAFKYEDAKNVSFLPVKKTIFACVTEQFDCCDLDKSKEMTDLLIEHFKQLLPIEQIELEMVKKVIVSITVKENGRITVRFLNGAEIDEEDNYADSNNALPEDNNEN